MPLPVTTLPTTDSRGRAAPLPPDERRSAIIEAALPLLTEHGPSVTTRQLATAAGVSEGTIFKVFADKDALVAAAVDRVLDRTILENALGGIDRSLPPEDQLRHAVAFIQQRTVDVWRLLSRVSPQHRPSPAGPLPHSPALADLLATSDLVRVAPEEAAGLLRGLTLALSHPLLVADPKPPAEIVDLFLNGVGRRA